MESAAVPSGSHPAIPPPWSPDVGPHTGVVRRIDERARGYVAALVESTASSGASGELVLRVDDVGARIHFEEGRIGWVRREGAGRARLMGLLQEELGLERAVLVEVLRESQARHQAFPDTLVTFELATETEVRTVLRTHFRRQLRGLEAEQGTVRTLFVPTRRSSGSRFRFAASELAAVPENERRDLGERLERLEKTIRNELPEALAVGMASVEAGWTLSTFPSADAAVVGEVREFLHLQLTPRAQTSSKRQGTLHWGERFVLYVVAEAGRWALTAAKPDVLPGRIFAVTSRALAMTDALRDGV